MIQHNSESANFFKDQKYKSLKDIIEAQPFSKEKILTSLKVTLSSCINK